MMRAIIIIFMLFNFFNTKAYSKYEVLAYNFTFKSIDGGIINFNDFKKKIIVVVNVASRCGYTPQYEDLQNLYDNFKENLVVVGVPSNNFKQEPGSNKDIKDFCETNFGISFPMTEKTNVIGKKAHPFFQWAKENHGISAIPKWNFHKILIGKDGKILDTFASFTKPSSDKFLKVIKKELEVKF